MLEAATWAPSHHLTEPWHFIVFSNDLLALGQFLAEQYKATTTMTTSTTSADDDAVRKKTFVQAKYDKKIQNCVRASFVICILCTLDGRTNPAVEEVCSVAAAVQNMHLVATAHHVGAYWSTSGIYDKKTFWTQNNNVSLENPPALRTFLNLKEQDVCLGWMFVGPYGEEKKWPQGRRKPCRVQKR
jgi:nitroreductase